MKFLLAVLLPALLLIPSALSQSQSEMNAEAAEAYSRADAQMNAVYKKLLAARSEEAAFCTALRNAQRAWLKFVDLHMLSVFPVEPGESPRTVYGSMYSLDFAVEKQRLVEARTRELEALLPTDA